MALNIKNGTAERLARKVATETGESLTEAIVHSLEERLESLQRQRPAPTAETPITISSWPDLVKHLDELQPREPHDDFEGDITDLAWVFRGLKSSSYKLEPTIERENNMDWPVLELRIKSAFKARARVHLSTALIPADGEELTWLAQMQHYGVPTRLLDFSYSPFVALYFAIRSRYEKADGTHVRLCAVHVGAVNYYCEKVVEAAWNPRPQRKKAYKVFPSLNPDDIFYTPRESFEAENQWRSRIDQLLSAPEGEILKRINQRGCICAALPPSFNPRLMSQAGVFLLNCAEGLKFEKSLTTMMAQHKREWRKTFDIPVKLIPDIERRLFQMNIHEQSLFPDLEGLAGLIRQKIQLHWK